MHINLNFVRKSCSMTVIILFTVLQKTKGFKIFFNQYLISQNVCFRIPSTSWDPSISFLQNCKQYHDKSQSSTKPVTKQTLLTFKMALSDTGPGFCLGIICRQCDSTVNDLGKILSSPLLVFPMRKNNYN